MSLVRPTSTLTKACHVHASQRAPNAMHHSPVLARHSTAVQAALQPLACRASSISMCAAAVAMVGAPAGMAGPGICLRAPSPIACRSTAFFVNLTYGGKGAYTCHGLPSNGFDCIQEDVQVTNNLFGMRGVHQAPLLPDNWRFQGRFSRTPRVQSYAWFLNQGLSFPIDVS